MKAISTAEDGIARTRQVACDEGESVARARTGDVAAFEALYRAHVGRVYALCRRLSGSVSAAEDLTQEAFVKAWRNLPKFRGDSAFSTWLHRIAVNVALQHLRSQAGRLVFESDPPEKCAPAVPAGLRLDLEGAIAALPAGARAVFVLHDVEGYRHDEIAAATGIAPGTSKAHLHRARQLLREALNHGM